MVTISVKLRASSIAGKAVHNGLAEQTAPFRNVYPGIVRKTSFTRPYPQGVAAILRRAASLARQAAGALLFGGGQETYPVDIPNQPCISFLFMTVFRGLFNPLHRADQPEHADDEKMPDAWKEKPDVERHRGKHVDDAGKAFGIDCLSVSSSLQR